MQISNLMTCVLFNMVALSTWNTASAKTICYQGDQPAQKVYNPVAAKTLGIANSAQQLLGTFVKVAERLLRGSRGLPERRAARRDHPRQVLRVPHAARRVGPALFRPSGQSGRCGAESGRPAARRRDLHHGPRRQPSLCRGRRRDDVRGGSRLPRTRGAGHRETRGEETGRHHDREFGPAGNIVKQEFTIEKPGQRYLIHDAADPQNPMKDIYVTLQF